MILIKGEISGLSEMTAGLSGENFEKGLNRGLKRVGTAIKTRASAAIRKQYNLKESDVDSKFEVIASAGVVLVTCTSRPINLTLFGAKQIGSVGGKRLTVKRVGDSVLRGTKGKAGLFGGVAASIKRDSTTLLPGAFIAKVKAGNKGASNIGVFRRTNKNASKQYIDPRNRRKTNRPYVMSNRTKSPRKAIRNLAVKTVSALFEGSRVKAEINQYLDNEALQVVLHEVDWAMKNEK